MAKNHFNMSVKSSVTAGICANSLNHSLTQLISGSYWPLRSSCLMPGMEWEGDLSVSTLMKKLFDNFSWSSSTGEFHPTPSRNGTWIFSRFIPRLSPSRWLKSRCNGLQTILALSDVCRLFAYNVGPLAFNSGRMGRILSNNSGRKSRCLQVLRFMFAGRYK